MYWKNLAHHQQFFFLWTKTVNEFKKGFWWLIRGTLWLPGIVELQIDNHWFLQLGIFTVLFTVYNLGTQLCTLASLSPDKYLFFCLCLWKGWIYSSTSGLQSLDLYTHGSVAGVCVFLKILWNNLWIFMNMLLALFFCLTVLNLFNVVLWRYILALHR